jgi:hypothetical protein
MSEVGLDVGAVSATRVDSDAARDCVRRPVYCNLAPEDEPEINRPKRQENERHKNKREFNQHGATLPPAKSVYLDYKSVGYRRQELRRQEKRLVAVRQLDANIGAFRLAAVADVAGSALGRGGAERGEGAYGAA